MTLSLSSVLLCAVAVVGLIAQAPFDPALERQLWKTLLPMGGDLAIAGPNFTPVPRRASVNTPSPFRQIYDIDENGLPIYVSLTDPDTMPGATPELRAQQAYDVEVNRLRATDGSLTASQGQCTFSNFFDTLYDAVSPQWRQCVEGNRMVPPPPGAMVDPVGVATDGTTVYVVDDQNNRVQAYDFDGHVKPMKYPIGNGIPGSGSYSYPSYFPYAGFPGYETFDGGYSGTQLNGPNGIAVDASHTIAVADSFNNRLAMFSSDGASLFNFTLPEQFGIQFKPTLVAVTPGATILPVGLGVPPGHENDRIVVTDWGHCMVQIYTADFTPVKTLPAELPAIAIHDACKSGDPSLAYPTGTPTFDGEFSTVTGVTVDQSGHIYVTDNAQNVVQVFDVNGNTLGWIGKPGVQPAPGAILGPVGVAIDHLGRVGVIDAGNSRVVFYDVAYSPTNVPTATFSFQLDTVVSVGDFPMGLAEQWGTTANGLDPKGRFVATDPWGKQILRFELPELGIVDAQAAVLASQPPGQPVGQLTGRGTFKVAVPRQKDADVHDVKTFVVPQQPGVNVIAGSLTPTNSEVPAIDIGPAEFVPYEFLYTTTADVTEATFTINARGDFDGTTYLAEAPVAEARSRSLCATCDATHEVYWLNQGATPGLATPITNPTTGTWYPAGVSVRLLPIPADGSVTSIGWQYGGASSTFYTQHAVPQETPLGSAGYVDVPVGVAGTTTLTYWAITGEGSASAPHTVDLKLDLIGPTGAFLIWPPYTGSTDGAGQHWYNHNITVGYTTVDAQSGTDQDAVSNPALADDTITFATEGRDLSQDVSLTDRVGHVTVANSKTASGGQTVNIDKIAPVFDVVPGAISVPATGTDELGGYATLPVGSLVADVHDPDIAIGVLGSGVVPLVPPGDHRFHVGVNTWTYTATDYAGNTTEATTTVTVTAADAVLTADDRSVRYGGSLVVGARVSAHFASGKVTFSFGPYTVEGHVVGEVATAVIPAVLTSVGDYTMTVDLTEDPAIGNLHTTATITVMPALVNVTAHAKTKTYGDANPAFTATVLGAVNDESINYSMSTTADLTTGVGVAPITVAFGSNPNYQLTSQDALLTINPRPATVNANAKSRVFGANNPPLDANVTGTVNGDVLNYSLSTTAVPLSNVGGYPISVTLGSNPNYTVGSSPTTLTISVKPIVIDVNAKSKTYGDANPAFDAVVTGDVAGASLGYAVNSTALLASGVGSYPITATFTPNSNYSVTVHNATLTVTQRAATIAANPKSRLFGLVNPLLDATVTGAVFGDVLNYTLNTTAVLLSPVGSYPITVTPGSNPNYLVTPVDSSLSIGQTLVTITPNAKSRAYGDANPTLDAVVTGLPVGALLNYTLNTTATTTSPVGSYPITVSLGLNPSLSITVNESTLAVTPRAIAVTAAAKTKVYGAADPSLTYGFTGGPLVGTDAFTGALTRATGNTVGTYAISQGTLALSANYTLSFTGANLSITQKPATVTASGGTKVFGTPDPPFSASSSGFIVGDDVTFSATRATGDNVGTYLVTPTASGSALPNYQVTYTTANFTITKAPITVTPASFTITYGEAQPTLTFSYGPFPAGNSSTDITTPPSCSITGAHTNAGSYTISCSGGNATNFSFDFGTGSLVINKKAASVTAGSGTKVYGSNDPALSTARDGFLASDLANLTFTTTRATGENVGSYTTTATVGGSAAGNYQVSATAGSFTITKATPTVTITGGTFTYDGAAHAATCTVAGVNNESLTGTVSYVPGPGAPVNAGTYTATCVVANPNYTDASRTAEIRINPKPITLKANDAQKISGAIDPTLTVVEPTGFVAADNIVITVTRAAGEAIGSYTITPAASGAKIGNYTVTIQTGVFKIVSDNKPPVCSAAYGGEIWPPNHKRFYATPINGVTDPEGGAITLVVTGIWQDELLDSTGDGKFSPDGKGVGTNTAWVRAERNGVKNTATGDGRVYEILFKATDNKGASCTGSVMWTVPHDQGQGSTAIDSGVRYDSTGVIPGARDKWQIHQNSPQP